MEQELDKRHMKRRKTDRSYLAQLMYIILEGDISLVTLLGGLGLILWAAFGLWRFGLDLQAYADIFPFGNATFWALNYILCGIGMWWMVAAQFPSLFSLLIGGWIWTIWSWSFFARSTAVATLQTGNATSIIYIIIGLLIIHRSSKK